MEVKIIPLFSSYTDLFIPESLGVDFFVSLKVGLLKNKGSWDTSRDIPPSFWESQSQPLLGQESLHSCTYTQPDQHMQRLAFVWGRAQGTKHSLSPPHISTLETAYRGDC